MNGYVPYENAFELCEELLTVGLVAIAALWAHIVWVHHSIGKRLDRLVEKEQAHVD